MPAPQAIATFPGVEQFASWAVTFAKGITPGVIQLRIKPQEAKIPITGDFTITAGDEQIIFKDCEVDSSSFQFNDSGLVVSLAIKDFRHKWRGGAIYGVYNLRGPDGKIVKREGAPAGADPIENTERTPQELAKLLLEAMGVTTFSIDTGRDTMRPFCDWSGTNPAQALADLCEIMAWAICPTPDGQVNIRPLGEGEPLPEGYIEQFSGAIDPPEKPKSLIVHCGPTLFQQDYLLEMVGLDTDGKIKLPNDLSYKPAAGWDTIADVQEFTDIANPKLRELAKRSMFRWFRIKTSAINPLKIFNLRASHPDVPFDFIGFVEQLIVTSNQVRQTVTESRVEVERGIVYGAFTPTVTATDKSTTALLGIPDDEAENPLPPDVLKDVEKLTQLTVPYGFSISERWGQYIIEFSEPVYFVPHGTHPFANKFNPPILYLRTAVSVLNPKTRTPARYSRERILNAASTNPPRYLQHHEIVLQMIDGQPQHLADTQQEIDYYLDAAEKEYFVEAPSSATYGWIIKVQLDGALQSITYTCDGNEGAKTTIERNQDTGSPIAQPYGIRRRVERERQLIDLAYKNTPTFIRQQVADAMRLNQIPGL